MGVQLPQQMIELDPIVDVVLLLRQHRNPIYELIEGYTQGKANIACHFNYVYTRMVGYQYLTGTHSIYLELS